MEFEKLGLHNNLLEAISYMGFDKATPIQELCIPPILEGRDILACAQTGTGKTAAFLLPVLHLMSETDHQGTTVLIIVPTRELAVQIDQQIKGIAYFVPVSSIAIYGGGDGIDFEAERRALTEGTEIIVATPGKIISHLAMGYFKLDQVKYLVLDEADRMLDIGFYDDILKILSSLPKKRQNLMFSATMPDKVRQLAKRILNNPAELSTAISKPAENVLQAAYLCYDNQKTDLITQLIADKPEYDSILIFSSTKKKVREIVSVLRNKKLNAEGISSDLEQNEREEVLNRFKARQIRILVATDVMSRGIDIKNIHLVINYDVPGDAEDYVHRIGRTARADASGVALTFINEEDMLKFHKIEKLIENEVIKLHLPTNIGEGPEWKVKFPSNGKKRRYYSKKKSKTQNKKRKG